MECLPGFHRQLHVHLDVSSTRGGIAPGTVLFEPFRITILMCLGMFVSSAVTEEPTEHCYSVGLGNSSRGSLCCVFALQYSLDVSSRYMVGRRCRSFWCHLKFRKGRLIILAF